jgi:hypothetical protein
VTLDLVELLLEPVDVHVNGSNVTGLDGSLRDVSLVLGPGSDGVGRDAVEHRFEEFGCVASISKLSRSRKERALTVLGGSVAEESFRSRVERVQHEFSYLSGQTFARMPNGLHRRRDGFIFDARRAEDGRSEAEEGAGVEFATEGGGEAGDFDWLAVHARIDSVVVVLVDNGNLAVPVAVL